MALTPNYSFIIPTGTDAVNLLTQCYPNFSSLDTLLKPIQESGVTVATDTKVGTVHQLVRTDSSCNMFRFIATGNYASGDTFTVDGASVTATAMDGTTLPNGAFVINQSVIAVVNGAVLTVMIAGKETTSIAASAVTYDNTLSGLIATDTQDAIDELHDSANIAYDNTVSGLTATDVKSAIDEVAGALVEHGLYELWANPNPSIDFAAGNVVLTGFDSTIWDAIEIEAVPALGWSYKMGANVIRFEKSQLSGGTLNAQVSFMTIGSNGKITNIQRKFVITLAGTTLTLAFDDCTNTLFSTYGAAGSASTSNDMLVPFRILGLRHNS